MEWDSHICWASPQDPYWVIPHGQLPPGQTRHLGMKAETAALPAESCSLDLICGVQDHTDPQTALSRSECSQDLGALCSQTDVLQRSGASRHSLNARSRHVMLLGTFKAPVRKAYMAPCLRARPQVAQLPSGLAMRTMHEKGAMP